MNVSLQTSNTNMQQSNSFKLRLVCFLLIVSWRVSAQAVVTAHYDNARTGQNVSEVLLTPSNVNSSSFGKLFSVPVDGFVYAQPLYLPNLTISGKGNHNVVFVATEHDSVYAFDADTNGGVSASPLWKASLFDSAHGAASGARPATSTDVGTSDIVPEIGITGTPVIDVNSGTIYVVSKTVENGVFVQRLHALDVASGQEKFAGPVVLQASVPGTGNGSSGGFLHFDPKWAHNRPGLLLLNGIVYLGFGSHGDNGPWHGWILGYNAKTLAQTGALCTTPNGIGSGIWMSGAGLAADVVDSVNHPYGRMFIPTGNGSYDASTPYGSNMDFGDDELRLDLTGGVPTVVDAFTPSNQLSLDQSDEDFGSGGALLLPDQSVGGHKHLLLQVGKPHALYLIDRDTLGGYNSTDNIVQELQGQTVGSYGAPAYWNGNVYAWGITDQLKMYSLVNGKLSTQPVSVSSETFGYPGATPVISANGASNGIVWAVQTDAYGYNGPAVLVAHSATNVANTLYSSAQNSTRDNPGNSVKYAVPMVTNGKVYVGTQSQLSVYGLLGAQQQTAAPDFTPASQSFSGTLSVSLTDNTTGATIYYTTDGSTPSQASALYTGPIGVTTTTTIKAIASASGYLQSAVSSATYTLQNQTATPVFAPAAGTYVSAQSVTISDATSGAAIRYTTDGSTPTAASALYSGAITVSASKTLKAIAIASGLTNSTVATASYTIQSSGTGINFGNGFASALSTMTFNGSTKLDDSRLQLTDAGANEASSAFYNTPFNIQSFTNDFNFQLSSATADGFTFTIQANSPTALGPPGGGLGYGPLNAGGTGGIPNSIAIKFDFFNNLGEGSNSTGLYKNGASPTLPASDLTSSGINLASGDSMAVHMTYDGTTLTMTITDFVTNAKYSTSWPVNIPSVIGNNTAYLGFTGGTGGLTASQKILTWTFVSTAAGQTAAAPAFSPAGGTYSSAQSVTMSDATSGAVIHYTTDASTPTASSPVYTAPVNVSATTTLKAIAVASGYTNSAVTNATYTIQATAAATPVFSPAGGAYTSAQSVLMSDATSGAVIHYTTDASTPTASSPVYTAPVNVSATTTLKAIAVASGYNNSAVAAATYTIQSGGTTGINFGSGFSGATSTMTLNGGAQLDNTRLQLTNGTAGQATSAFFNTVQNIQSFTNDFTFQLSNATADGFTFTIQSNSPAALGPAGGGLGYGPHAVGGTGGIPNSVAVKFDIYNNGGEGSDSTGLYTNGASPTVPSNDLTGSGINLSGGDTMAVHMTYNGTTLAMTITDTVTNARYSTSWAVNIPGAVGASTAYIGFTAGDGGLTANQEILTWTFVTSGGGGGQTAATPAFSPAGGTYSSAQSVTISDATSGAIIHYTTDASTPTASSPTYSAPINVSAATTLKAIAVASGYSNSAVASATYTIQAAAAATPVFSPAGGTYTSAQSVTISDVTAGAVIHYTTDASTPTASSPVYSAPINVSVNATLKAIAIAGGYANSAIATAAYTIQSGTGGINFAGGFSGATSTMAFNGGAQLDTTRLQLTNGTAGQATSAFFTAVQNVQSFTNDFTFQLLNATADGFTFTIQGNSPAAVGPLGGGLGYGPQNVGAAGGIPNSVAIKFDIYNNNGEGSNSTGLYTNGASPTLPANDLSGSGINLASGDIMAVHMTYNGTTLTMTITDTVTNAVYSTTWTVNIPAAVGANTAYIGFTAGDGGLTANQEILTWTYTHP